MKTPDKIYAGEDIDWDDLILDMGEIYYRRRRAEGEFVKEKIHNLLKNLDQEEKDQLLAVTLVFGLFKFEKEYL